MAFGLISVATICDDLPCLARSDRSMRVAERAHIIAAGIIVVGQRKARISLKVSSVDAEQLIVVPL